MINEFRNSNAPNRTSWPFWPLPGGFPTFFSQIRARLAAVKKLEESSNILESR
jgi:hypothetical protein